MKTGLEKILGKLAPLLLAAPLVANAGQVTLAWNPSPSNEVTGYTAFHGPSSGNYTNSIDLGNVTSFTIANLTDGATRCFAVKAHDGQGNISGFSNEVCTTLAATTLGESPQTLQYKGVNDDGEVIFRANGPVTLVQDSTNPADYFSPQDRGNGTLEIVIPEQTLEGLLADLGLENEAFPTLTFYDLEGREIKDVRLVNISASGSFSYLLSPTALGSSDPTPWARLYHDSGALSIKVPNGIVNPVFDPNEYGDLQQDLICSITTPITFSLEDQYGNWKTYGTQTCTPTGLTAVLNLESPSSESGVVFDWSSARLILEGAPTSSGQIDIYPPIQGPTLVNDQSYIPSNYSYAGIQFNAPTNTATITLDPSTSGDIQPRIFPIENPEEFTDLVGAMIAVKYPAGSQTLVRRSPVLKLEKNGSTVLQCEVPIGAIDTTKTNRFYLDFKDLEVCTDYGYAPTDIHTAKIWVDNAQLPGESNKIYYRIRGDKLPY